VVGYFSCFLLLIEVGTRLKGAFLIQLEFGMLGFERKGNRSTRWKRRELDCEQSPFFSRFGEESVRVRDIQETSAAASSVSRLHSRAW